MVSILCPFISLEVTTWSGELWLKEGEARRVSGWSPVLLPSCLPSTRPLPGAFFPVSFLAINSGVSPRSGSSQEQEEASPYGRLKQHPPLPGEEAERAFSCLSSTPLGQLPQAEVSASFTMRYLSPVLHPLYLRAPSRISSLDKRSSLACLQSLLPLHLIQPFPFHTSNLTTSPE